MKYLRPPQQRSVPPGLDPKTGLSGRASGQSEPALTRLARTVRIRSAKLLQQALFALGEHRSWNGFDIYCSRAFGGSSANIEKVVAALQLIQELDSRRFGRLRRLMPRVYIGWARTSFWDFVSTGSINIREAVRASEALIAVLLVFQSVYARYAHLRNSNDMRLTRLGVKEQIRFANRLPREDWPATDALIAHFRMQLVNLPDR